MASLNNDRDGLILEGINELSYVISGISSKAPYIYREG